MREKAKKDPFYQWFTTFLEEKEIELGEGFKNDKGIYFQLGDIVQTIISFSPPEEQEEIKKILVQIDFLNGDPLHFFRHIANALTQEDKDKIENLKNESFFA